MKEKERRTRVRGKDEERREASGRRGQRTGNFGGGIFFPWHCTQYQVKEGCSDLPAGQHQSNRRGGSDKIGYNRKEASMVAKGVLLSISIWLVWSVMVVEGGGNCTRSVGVELRRENTHYEFRGMSARIRPSRNYEVVDGVGEITWSIRALVERNKTRYNVLGEELFLAQCSSPSGLYGFDPAFNPLQPHEPSTVCGGGINVPCGPLLQHWSLDDFDCYAQSSLSLINGVNVSTILIRSWLSGSPSSFVMTASYQVAEADVVVVIPRTNTNQTIHYRYVVISKITHYLLHRELLSIEPSFKKNQHYFVDQALKAGFLHQTFNQPGSWTCFRLLFNQSISPALPHHFFTMTHGSTKRYHQTIHSSS